MQIKAIPGDALAQGAGLERDIRAGAVADCCHDFHALQTQRLESVARQRLYRAQGHALALARLAHPVAEIAQLVLLADFIEAGATEEFAAVLAKRTIFPGRATGGLGAAVRKPLQCLGLRIGAGAPRHPGRDRGDRLAYGGGKRFGIVIFKGPP